MIKFNKVFTTIFTLLVTFSVSLPLCFAENIIKIGYTAPFTGAAAEFGTNGWRGVQLALSEINSKGITINGKKYTIEVARYDSLCGPTDAVSNIRKMALQDKVSAILGDHCSSACLAIAPLCQEFKIPGITIECAADAVTKPGYDYYFRMRAPVGLIAPLFGPTIFNKFKPKTAGYLVVNDDYGLGLAQALEKSLKPLGVNTTKLDTFERGNTDYSVNLAMIKKEKPDIVFFVGTSAEGAMILKQAKDMNVTETTKFVGSEEMGEMEFLSLAGESVAENTYAYTLWGDAPESFVKKVKEEFNAPMHYAIIFAYDATKIIASAIESAQSTNPEKIRDALTKTDYKGLQGQIQFLNFDGYKNQRKASPYLMQWKSGKRIIEK